MLLSALVSASAEEAAKPPQERIEDYLAVDPMEVELGVPGLFEYFAEAQQQSGKSLAIWSLAYNELEDSYHFRAHLEQMTHNIEAARQAGV